jgi:hypothetical protein
MGRTRCGDNAEREVFMRELEAEVGVRLRVSCGGGEMG